MTPDTSGYYHAAYVAAGILYTAYTAWLVVRARRVRARLDAAREAASRP